MLRRKLFRSFAVCALSGTTLLLITSCGGPSTDSSSSVPSTAPGDSTSSAASDATNANDPSVYHVKRDAEQKYKDNPGLPGWNEAARLTIEEKLGWDKLPDGEKKANLPPSISGVDFLGDDGTEVRCLRESKATILTPADQAPIDATYTIGEAGKADALDLKYTDNGKACHVVYAAQCIGRKAMLNLQSATLPKLPSVLRGTLP